MVKTIRLSIDTNIWLLWFKRELSNYKHVNLLMKKITAFDAEFEVIFPDMLLYEVIYKVIKEGKKKGTAWKREVFKTLDEITKSSKVIVVKSK